jgi:hypothetical protein
MNTLMVYWGSPDMEQWLPANHSAINAHDFAGILLYHHYYHHVIINVSVMCHRSQTIGRVLKRCRVI